METDEAQDRGSPTGGHPSGATLCLGDLIIPAPCLLQNSPTSEGGGEEEGREVDMTQPSVSPENGFESAASSTE